MDSGLYAACAGLVARTRALDLAANNLANTSTIQAKRQITAVCVAADVGLRIQTLTNQSA